MALSATVTTISTMTAFLVLAMLLGVGMEFCHGGEVYKVGDSAGWTIIGNVNYTSWSSSKNFHFGDTILFVYNKQFHNVVEVRKADYRTCNASNPMSTYDSGNDSVLLKHKGHFFFLCGVAAHCQMGQKVDIRIPKNASVAPATPTPVFQMAPMSPPPPPSHGLATQPQESHGFRTGGSLSWSPLVGRSGFALAICAGVIVLLV